LDHEVSRTKENVPAGSAGVTHQIAATPTVTHVAMVHCETTTGIMNPVGPIGEVVRGAGKTLIVDAMSSFGAVPLSLDKARIDFLVSSANKCIEGVPGFSFVLARRDQLAECGGQSRSVSLDLYEQWKGLDANGQFRFTPPTHAILAFAQALRELTDEGGVAGRAARYQANHRKLMAGMGRLGFQSFVAPEHQSYIITSFLCPDDPRFDFEEFYLRLSRCGMVLYPGKVGSVDSFRIGTIGRLFESDVEALLDAMAGVLGEMKISIPVAPPKR
jgi:2-aminoethylphosphonate-pyruvate transaminase